MPQQRASIASAFRESKLPMEEKKELLNQDERVVEIEMERLRGFVNHPFKVQADSQMIELQESIKKYGILNPLIVRPRQDGTYEIISGHRRKFAAEKIGYRNPILSADEDRMGYEKYFMEQLNIEALKQDWFVQSDVTVCLLMGQFM